MDEDKIEKIPKTMEKFLGCTGEMIKPSPNTVKAVIKKIPKGKLVTLEQVREKLANDFQVQTACPASTAKALQTLSNENSPACYWRVIKKKGELNSRIHNGIENHASLLQKEGIKIDFGKKIPVVIDYKAKLSKLL